MRIWIDLANSPHPLLFEPIARGLEERGAEVAVTVRDHAQTAELARRIWPRAEVIGGSREEARGGRSGEIASRSLALARWARRTRPDLAFSHNSYAQIAAAWMLAIPRLTAMDYEHQPANHLAFRLADRILVPTALPVDELSRQGAKAHKLVRYDGFKELIYLADFEPDPAVLDSLGRTVPPGLVLLVARAAAAGAAYHRGENPIFEDLLRRVDQSGRFFTVVLARHPEQRRRLAALGLERALLPDGAVDGRSLLCSADAFIGAGGTMTREAALLGTPSFSVFAGRPAAVDGELERRGLLTHVGDAEELIARLPIAPAARVAEGGGSARREALAKLRKDGLRVRETFVANAVEVARMRPRRR